MPRVGPTTKGFVTPARRTSDTDTGARHHLVHHGADAATAFFALPDLAVFRVRAERAAETELEAP